MAEDTKHQARDTGSVQQHGRPCPRDCRRCPMAQQVCCAAMLSFQAFEVMDAIVRRLDAQSQHLAELEERLSALRPPEAELASPAPVQGDLFPAEP